ncbi:IS1595 family transposase [Citromicrobium bathyomarinum]|uniref:IS1595 family transposase n=1 Tax=Citromicrobium bathyomarinum TaxID=72174 RepID=UPI003159ED79
MPKQPTLRQFQHRFPTEESCLEHLKIVRFGERHECEKCGKNAQFYRVQKRRSYACEHCGHQVYPTAGTPFHRTRTGLRDWFYVMFLFCSTRNGVAAKEVERQIGVTYKTAWRMCHEIRKYMAMVDGDEPLGGEGMEVEIDETLIGGKARTGRQGPNLANKTVVLGMVERGGNLITRVVPNHRRATLLPQIEAAVRKGTLIHTDHMHSYAVLGSLGYSHERVNHNAGQYVSATGSHVQSIEGFWSQLKRGINGTHIHVSAKHLPKYLSEFEFRHNRRNRPETMLDELMQGFWR